MLEDITKCPRCNTQFVTIEPVISSLDENGEATKMEYVCGKCGYRKIEEWKPKENNKGKLL
ncbi:MAG: hypothetical protein KQ78_00430 [Candidatus Izimaplasma bacterium HR2]|nr:MAG: hypothetical protein KQ78_00430 [Candidatus Izimaplasma bacterium HR2]